MQIIDVPARFQSPFHAYPPHTRTNIESYFLEFAKKNADKINTQLSYLPILWTNNYVSFRNQEKRSDFRSDPEIRRWLQDNEVSLGQCFTIVQNDDGPYEPLPAGLTVFGAGGTGNVAIPLLCDPHPVHKLKRDKTAFFLGQSECGGPEQHVHGRSSWDPNGAGARVRRAMFRVFEQAGNPLCDLRRKPFGNPQTEFEIGLASSVFGLAPRGYGRTSFRLYEAMQLGAIPVYIYDEPWLPFSDELHWPAFCVMCPESELSQLPDRLRNMTQAEISRLQDNLERIYPDYFTFEATCWQIVKILERA